MAPGGLSSDSRADCHSKRPDTSYTLTQTSSPVTRLWSAELFINPCVTLDFWEGGGVDPNWSHSLSS